MATAVDITGMSTDALHLKNMLDGIMSRVEAVYQSYNVPLPNRRYWMMGQPAVDCEQVVVSFMQMYLGSPSAEKIEQSSHMSAIDSWVLMETIREFDMWDDTGYGLGVIATLDVAPPEGGFQTTVMNITMAVP